MELYCYHNSREKSYRLPNGALAAGEKAVLRLRLWGRDAADANCLLRLWDGRENLISGERTADAGGVNLIFHITTPKTPQLIWYYFIIDLDGKRLYYGAASGVGKLTVSPPSDYQITVYDSGFETPKWFQKAIIYQIFPDRFCRGGRDSNGLTSRDRLEYHQKLGRKVFFHEDWNEAALYKPLDGEKHYSPCDYFGGDLRGIREKLPYLSSLGIKCLYLNPIFEAASNHRYNTADYLRVDPVLGDENELKLLSEEASRYGIRIMLDGVFSHTGDDSVYFNKYGNYSEPGAYKSRTSPYWEWYDFERFPDKYRCWWGFKTLPEVIEDTPSYGEFIEGVLEKWARLSLTSWRLDVADELPDEFIKRLRRKLKRLDETGVLLGEVWEDASNKKWEKGLRQYVYGHELDSVMNYPFRDAVVGFFTGRIDAYELNDILAAQRERYPAPFYRSCMNILGSHDSERILTALGGAPGRELSRREQARFQLDEESLFIAKKRLLSAAVLQFSMPQPPCIYYGDEAGMTGLFDPFNRETYPWGREDALLTAHYRRLGELRNTLSALHSGKAAFRAITGDVFAILRGSDEGTALALVNRSAHERTVSIGENDFYEGPDAGEIRLFGEFEDAFTSKRFRVTDGRLFAVLGAYGAALLISQNS